MCARSNVTFPFFPSVMITVIVSLTIFFFFLVNEQRWERKKEIYFVQDTKIDESFVVTIKFISFFLLPQAVIWDIHDMWQGKCLFSFFSNIQIVSVFFALFFSISLSIRYAISFRVIGFFLPYQFSRKQSVFIEV